MTRLFEGGPEAADIQKLCVVALRAPSAGFSQGAHLFLLSHETDIRADVHNLSDFWHLSGAQTWFEKTAPGVLRASAVVLVLGDQQAYTNRYSEGDKIAQGLHDASQWSVPYWLTDAAMVAENLLLLIEEKGWGALFFGLAGKPRATLDALGIPASVHCIGAIAIGYRAPQDKPTGSSVTHARRPTTDSLHIGRWLGV